MKLVFGLGNPGRRYAGTRHNVGFQVLEELARRHAGGPPRTRDHAEVVDVQIGSEKTLLIAPVTWMNHSGQAVAAFVNFYRPDPDDFVVICDDMNLPDGRIRWRAGGSAGGQNGLKDIIRRLGHSDFPRLRIGIGRPPGRMTATDWVLGRFPDAQRPQVEQTIARAADSVEHWIHHDLSSVMNQYNRDPDGG